MRIQVEFEAQLRTALGQGVVDLDIAEGSSIVDALRAVVAQGPEAFAARVFSEDGTIRPSLFIVVGESAVSSLDAGAYSLSVDDRVVVMPPIAGG